MLSSVDLRHRFGIQVLLCNLAHRPAVNRSLIKQPESDAASRSSRKTHLGLGVGKLKCAKNDLLHVLSRADLSRVAHVLAKNRRLVDGAASHLISSRSLPPRNKDSLLKPMNKLVPRPLELVILRERTRSSVDEDGSPARRNVVHRSRERLRPAIDMNNDRRWLSAHLRVPLRRREGYHLRSRRGELPGKRQPKFRERTSLGQVTILRLLRPSLERWIKASRREGWSEPRLTKACVMPASTRTWREGCGGQLGGARGGWGELAYLEEDVGSGEDHSGGAASSSRG